MKINGLGKTGLPSRYKGNVIAATTNAVLNTKIVRGGTDAVHITPNGLTLELTRESSSNTFLGMHPFKLYATGEINGSGWHGYQVRSGQVGVRPLFHQFLTVNQPGYGASFTFGDYSTPFVPDDTDGATPDTNSRITPAIFFLDPTPEILTSVNYGAYYAFWIEIRPDTDNAGLWDGVVFINYHRFTVQTAASIYDGYVFPSLPDANGYEYIPIAVLQLTHATNIFGTFSSTDGEIYQFKRDHCIQRFPAGQNSLSGFGSVPEDWIKPLPDASVSSGNRWWYPGDFIYFYTGTPNDAFNGYYVWRSSPGRLGGTPSGPLDGASAFAQVAQFG